MTYYKATRPNFTSFHDSKTLWTVGKTVEIPPDERRPELCGPGILHASDAPGETLVGGNWPCRLFEVEGISIAQDGHKHGFHSLTVIRELPAWQALGPNGQAVAAHIEKCKTITREQAKMLDAAREAVRTAALYAARDAAREAAWEAARAAAWAAARDATWNATWNAEREAVRAAAWAAAALVVRDLISPEQVDILYGPWAQVMEVTE